MMRKMPLSSQESERCTIAPDQLVHLSLYSNLYSGFTLCNWPADVAYPSDARSLMPKSLEKKDIKDWAVFKVLQGFCAGTSYERRRHVLKFTGTTWSKHRNIHLMIME